MVLRAVALLILCPARAETVRVRVFSKYELTETVVRSPDGRRVLRLDARGRTRRSIRRLAVPPGGVYIEADALSPRLFTGAIEFAVRDGRVELVNALDLEDYLPGVLASEASEIGEEEALKAMAVVSRTYALAERGRHGSFDFCDLTHCQAFRGLQSVPRAVRRAAQATRGEVLTRGGAVVRAFYHSTCGGETEYVGHAWPGSSPESHLVPVRDSPASGDPYCAHSPQFRWTSVLGRSELERLAASRGWLDPGSGLRSFGVLRANPRGRVLALAFVGDRRTEVPALDFLAASGRAFGWSRVKSTAFTVREEGDGYRLEGRGLGHGVGLCQRGAQGMARQGKSYREILLHYFPGTVIGAAQIPAVRRHEPAP